jgi:hypothetical protein
MVSYNYGATWINTASSTVQRSWNGLGRDISYIPYTTYVKNVVINVTTAGFITWSSALFGQQNDYVNLGNQTITYCINLPSLQGALNPGNAVFTVVSGGVPCGQVPA